MEILAPLVDRPATLGVRQSSDGSRELLIGLSKEGLLPKKAEIIRRHSVTIDFASEEGKALF